MNYLAILVEKGMAGIMDGGFITWLPPRTDEWTVLWLYVGRGLVARLTGALTNWPCHELAGGTKEHLVLNPDGPRGRPYRRAHR